MEAIKDYAGKGDRQRTITVETVTDLIDKHYETENTKRSDLISLFEETLFGIFDTMRSKNDHSNGTCQGISWETRADLKEPASEDQILLVDAYDFPPEGNEGLCQFLDKSCGLGWSRIILYRCRGQRNIGAGLITKNKVRIDVYGTAGDCLAAFADGPEFHIHGDAQDSVAYCFRSGKLVIHGDAGPVVVIVTQMQHQHAFPVPVAFPFMERGEHQRHQMIGPMIL
jgi:formylmethanofuran dehydrogenase subunit C